MSKAVPLVLGLLALALCGFFYAKPRANEPKTALTQRSLLPTLPPTVNGAATSVASVQVPSAIAAVSTRATPTPALTPTTSAALSPLHDGPCGPQSSADATQARDTLRARFSRVTAPPGAASLYFEPSLPRVAVDALLDALTHMDSMTSARLGLHSSAPDVFLYKDAEQLRQGVCVSPRTVSYYDGAIHLAFDARDDFLTSLRHEYTHHALFSHGLRRPVWFQEGVAMMLGGELQWLRWHPKGALLPVQSMVQTFPQTASTESAEAFYGQAFAMTAFLNQLCKNKPQCSLRDLVNALESGAGPPERLFDWAVSERGADLVRTARLPLWDDYVANGLQLSRATTQAIAERR